MENDTTTPVTVAAIEPQRFEFVELFGHNCLGPCAVQEVQRYGATFCEARPLKIDGTPGDPQLIAGSAIYRTQPISEEIAKLIATKRLGYVPLALAPRRDPDEDDAGGGDPDPDDDDDDEHGDDDDFDGLGDEPDSDPMQAGDPTRDSEGALDGRSDLADLDRGGAAGADSDRDSGGVAAPTAEAAPQTPQADT